MSALEVKPPSKRGQCGKNAIPKRGLTPTEEKRVEKTSKADRDCWNELMAKPWNKWEPTK